MNKHEIVLNISRNTQYISFTPDELADIFKNKGLKMYYLEALKILQRKFVRNSRYIKYKKIGRTHLF